MLAFHFPEYRTTLEPRKSYNVDVMRLLMPDGFFKQLAFTFVRKA